jgi:hypothetical protein
MWEAFNELVVSLHKPAPVPTDCSTYVDIDKFAEDVRTPVAPQAPVPPVLRRPDLGSVHPRWLRPHAAVLRWTQPGSLGVLPQHHPELAAAHLHHQVTAGHVSAGAASPVLQDLRHACCRRMWWRRARSHASYGAKVRIATKAYTDAVAMVCIATRHHMTALPPVFKVTVYICSLVEGMGNVMLI